MADLVSKFGAGFTSPLRAVDVRIVGFGSRDETTPSVMTEAPSRNQLGRESRDRVDEG